MRCQVSLLVGRRSTRRLINKTPYPLMRALAEKASPTLHLQTGVAPFSFVVFEFRQQPKFDIVITGIFNKTSAAFLHVM